MSTDTLREVWVLLLGDYRSVEAREALYTKQRREGRDAAIGDNTTEYALKKRIP